MAVTGLVLLLLGAIFFVIAFGISLTSFRRLVDLERTSSPEQWSADGKPSSRPFPHSLAEHAATLRTFNSWLTAHPTWAPPEGHAAALRGRMVRWLLLSVLGLLLFGAGVTIFGNAVTAA